jgi:branched-chain amino acid transport system ATP-binding protein
MLEVRDITAGYGDVTVLRNVSLTCPTGSAVALLGPNGAGKTTLMRVLSGLLKPTNGQILLAGEDVTGFRTSTLSKKGVCHIPEGRGIFPSLTVRENLALFSPRGKPQLAETFQRATQSFPILGSRMSQTAGSLSGGEQQMLAIVRAYLSNPRLVLVDEASIGLAPLVVEGIFKFLGQVAKEGTTLLIVEQYVTRALALADSVYVLNRGQVAFSGKSDALSSADIFETYLGVEV